MGDERGFYASTVMTSTGPETGVSPLRPLYAVWHELKRARAAALELAGVPGPTFAPLTADLRLPLNEAGERIGQARERRADAHALVARLTAGDVPDEPAVVGGEG